MKTLKSLLVVTAVSFGISAAAFALPPGKGGPAAPAMTKGDFGNLKPGDKVALVCKASDSIMLIDIKSQKQAMELCKAGKMVHCPLCKKSYKVTLGSANGKGAGPQTTVVAVNERGEPCMFFAKLVN